METTSGNFNLPTEVEPPVEDFSKMFVLIYGPPKIGKSTLASTFPKALFLATEEGLRFLPVLRKSCPDWLSFREIVKQLRMPEAKQHYKTIVIDTIDLLYASCENYICTTRKIRHPSEEEWGKGWSMVRDEFQMGVKYLTGEGYGVVFISHHKEVEATLQGIKKVKTVPSLSGTARRIILPLVDFIVYLAPDAKNPDRAVRLLHTMPTLDFEAGTRQAFFPEAIDDISYHGLSEALRTAKARELTFNQDAKE
ncbi:MAG: ATP-binding protein [Magnetococcus sp. WYHC-3]